VSSKVAAYTQNNTNTEKLHTDIHAMSGIRTHDPVVQAGEDGSYALNRAAATVVGETLL
jgi:hypothetical protein